MADTVKHPLVVAVVPAFNRCERTLRFISQFSKVDYPNKSVIITDDASTDNTYQNILMNFPDVQVIRGNGDSWWSGGTNAAIRAALEQGADYILTINDDVVMEPDFLTQMVAIAEQNPKYIVGCRIHRQDFPDRIWSVGTSPVFKRYEIFKLNFWDERWNDVKETVPNPYPVVTMAGNGVLIPRTVFSEVGYYDEKYMPQYHADSDFVLRASKRGYQPVISLESVLYNHIPTTALVSDRWNLIFNRKSDRYWKAVWTTLYRHGPFGKRLWLLMLQYMPFFVPQWAIRLARRLKIAQPTDIVEVRLEEDEDGIGLVPVGMVEQSK